MQFPKCFADSANFIDQALPYSFLPFQKRSDIFYKLTGIQHQFFETSL